MANDDRDRPPRDRGITPHLALLVVQIAFASQAVESKIVMAPRADGGEGFPPWGLGMLRMLGGALFFQVLLLVRARARSRPREESASLDRRTHLHLAGLGLLGVSLNQGLFLAGLARTTPVTVALLGASIPVFTAVLSVVLGKEAASLRLGLGLALSVLGVLRLTGVSTLDWGALIVAGNSLSYASYLVLSKNTILRVGALRLTAWIFTYGALSFVPFGLVPLVRALPEVTTRGACFLGYILLMPTIVAYSFNAWALGRTSPTMVAVYIYLQPLMATFLAWVQLGQRVDRKLAVAGALIFTGVGIVVSRRRPAPSRAG